MNLSSLIDEVSALSLFGSIAGLTGCGVPAVIGRGLPAAPRLPIAAAGSDLSTEPWMRLIIAIFLPFLLFFTIRRPIAGIICLVLQLTLVGWLPAALWAVYALSQWRTDQRLAGLERGR